MLHQLRIRPYYLGHILEGKKTFEVRKNDRDFQVGDKIRFLSLDDENYNTYIDSFPIPDYLITYILSGSDGLSKDYVCLAIIADIN